MAVLRVHGRNWENFLMNLLSNKQPSLGHQDVSQILFFSHHQYAKIYWFLQAICSNFRCLPNCSGHPCWRSFIYTYYWSCYFTDIYRHHRRSAHCGHQLWTGLQRYLWILCTQTCNIYKFWWHVYYNYQY